jgi:hypothetical protein
VLLSVSCVYVEEALPAHCLCSQSMEKRGAAKSRAVAPSNGTVSAAVWSRVDALRALDRDLEELDAALQIVHQIHARIAHRVAEELSSSCELAAAVATPGGVTFPRSFDFYLKQLVEMAQERPSPSSEA